MKTQKHFQGAVSWQQRTAPIDDRPTWAQAFWQVVIASIIGFSLGVLCGFLLPH